VKLSRRMGLIGIVILWGGAVLAGAPRLQVEGRALWEVTFFGEDDYFYQPSDIAVDRELKRIYVIETGNHRVSVFDFEGRFLKTVGSQGQGPGEFIRPTGACVREDSSLVVADHGNHRIQIFDAVGKHIETISTGTLNVADLAAAEGEYYTVPSFGNSGYNLNMGSEASHQPLLTVLNGAGDALRSFEVEDFADTHPFIRAIKHRVSLALSPEGRIYLPYFAINRVLVFDREGHETGRFDRPLPFKPRVPKLEKQTSADGRIAMRASMDMVSQAADFGPGGKLYLLTHIGSFVELMKGVTKREDIPRPPMRIDVIEPASRRLERSLPCEAGTRAFAVLDARRLVCVFENDSGEIVLSCIGF